MYENSTHGGARNRKSSDRVEHGVVSPETCGSDSEFESHMSTVVRFVFILSFRLKPDSNYTSETRTPKTNMQAQRIFYVSQALVTSRVSRNTGICS